MKVRRILFLTVLGVAVLLNGCGEKQTENKVSQEYSIEDEVDDTCNEANDNNIADSSNDINAGSGTDNNEANNGDETNDRNDVNGSNGSNNSNGSNSSNGSYALEEDVDKTAEANQNAVAQAGYYKIISGSDGGYMVMVHDGEYSYGIQLLQEYLAKMGCHAPNGMGGGWINPDLDQYMCYARGDAILPLMTEEDEEFWD